MLSKECTQRDHVLKSWTLRVYFKPRNCPTLGLEAAKPRGERNNLKHQNTIQFPQEGHAHRNPV